jgi:hypothetical protein
MLWEAWRLAKAYTTRPSEIYGIKDEVTAYSFDKAVYMFGSNLDAELKKAGQGAKSDAQANGRRQRVLANWLGGRAQYKDPAAGGGGVVTSAAGAGPVTL